MFFCPRDCFTVSPIFCSYARFSAAPSPTSSSQPQLFPFRTRIVVEGLALLVIFSFHLCVRISLEDFDPLAVLERLWRAAVS